MNPTETRFRPDNRKIVIFGAGRIGRSFIGQLFGNGSYKIVFVDTDPAIVSLLNSRNGYRIIIKGDKDEEIFIKDVHAVPGSDLQLAAEELSSAGIAAVSVGKNALEKTIPVIAAGLKIRYDRDPACPLDIIIAENMIDAGNFMRGHLKKYLPADYPFERLVGLVETSIGKMVPLMTRADLEKDPLLIFAEPYNTLILDRKGFKSAIPSIKGLDPKSNIRAWVDRKAFIHNLGHTAAAWSGYYWHPDATYIFEVLDDKEVFDLTREVMIQSACALHIAYKDDFTKSDLADHIDDLLKRFRNKALKDTIYRVGHDLVRKLGTDDRFAGAIHLSDRMGTPSDKILKAMSYGFFFRARDEEGRQYPSDHAFLESLEKDFESAMIKDLHLDPASDRFIIEQLRKYYIQFSPDF